MNHKKPIKVGILSHAGWECGGGNILFPIFKNFRRLRSLGIRVSVFKFHKDPLLFESDVVIVIHRYFHALLKNTVLPDKSLIIAFLEKLRRLAIKIIFFDAGDASGSRELDLLPYVDKFLKKQLLKDRSSYLENNGDKSVRCWINTFDESSKEFYKPATAENLHKLQLGWNIGLTDYRNIPCIQKLGHLTNRLIWLPPTISSCASRVFDTQFRGNVNTQSAYVQQRNQVIEILNRLALTNKFRIQLGPRISRRKFLEELGKSKLCISPFGWGELCYRDFEAIQRGSVLIKPTVSHLETFPNYFIENKTYIPVRWDLADLEITLESVVRNYRDFVEVAKNAQQILNHFASHEEEFINHFQQSLFS